MICFGWFGHVLGDFLQWFQYGLVFVYIDGFRVAWLDSGFCCLCFVLIFFNPFSLTRVTHGPLVGDLPYSICSMGFLSKIRALWRFGKDVVEKFPADESPKRL